MQLQPGTLLQGGKYKIESTLGQGGFGITYLATQKVTIEGPIGNLETEVKVTIKEFFMKEVCDRSADALSVSVPSTGSYEMVERFKQKFMKEAQNISRQRHPNIIKVTDIFQENNTVYYVMEYIEGGSLQDYIKIHGALSEPKAIKYIQEIAAALSYLHQQRIMHLDVKPGNILLKKTGEAVLIDFGLSKCYDKSGQQTSTTPVGISPGYAPMEQYNKEGVGTFSPATDIYSLGATFYKLLTGITPPDAGDILNDGLPELPAKISTGTKQTIQAAMQPRRVVRPQTIGAFLQLLNEEVTTIPANEITINPVTPPIHIDEPHEKIKQPSNKKNENKTNERLVYGIAIVSVIIISFFIIRNAFFQSSDEYVLSSDSTQIAMTEEITPDTIEKIQPQPFSKLKATPSSPVKTEHKSTASVSSHENKTQYTSNSISQPNNMTNTSSAGEDNDIHDVVEVMPCFPGGTNDLMHYLANNIKYPTVAQENGTQGRVLVQFVVNKDGSIVDVKVVRSVDPYLDAEALRVVRAMPHWTPGKQKGKTVRVKFTVPITFRLS